MRAVQAMGTVLALMLTLTACERQPWPSSGAASGASSAASAMGEAQRDALSGLAPTSAGGDNTWADLPAVSPEDQAAYEQQEQRFATDPEGQWAVSAKASSSLNESAASKPRTLSESQAWRATGAIDGRTWSNGAEQRKGRGVDWLELNFERAVHASEVRVVMVGAGAVRSLVRMDVIEEGGLYRTV